MRGMTGLGNGGEKEPGTRPDPTMPSSGDPSLELFGHGWTPQTESHVDQESYEGRHRAPDA
jgi:hypothetical protein